MKIIANDREFEFDPEKLKLTLGELHQLKSRFGIANFTAIDEEDVDSIRGILFILEKRRNPAASDEAVIQWVDSVSDLDVITPEPAAEVAEPDPTPVVAEVDPEAGS